MIWLIVSLKPSFSKLLCLWRPLKYKTTHLGQCKAQREGRNKLLFLLSDNNSRLQLLFGHCRTYPVWQQKSNVLANCCAVLRFWSLLQKEDVSFRIYYSPYFSIAFISGDAFFFRRQANFISDSDLKFVLSGLAWRDFASIGDRSFLSNRSESRVRVSRIGREPLTVINKWLTDGRTKTTHLQQQKQMDR